VSPHTIYRVTPLLTKCDFSDVSHVGFKRISISMWLLFKWNCTRKIVGLVPWERLDLELWSPERLQILLFQVTNWFD